MVAVWPLAAGVVPVTETAGAGTLSGALLLTDCGDGPFEVNTIPVDSGMATELVVAPVVFHPKFEANGAEEAARTAGEAEVA